MNLSGIRPSMGFYDDNSIKNRPDINPIPVEQPVEDTAKDATKQFGKGPAATVEISREGIAAVKNNIEKAVNDMEEDTTIHQYQYFVQEKPAIDSSSVRGLENFSL